MKTIKVKYYVDNSARLKYIFDICVNYLIYFKFMGDEIVFYADDMKDFKSIQSVLGDDIINKDNIINNQNYEKLKESIQRFRDESTI